MKVLHVCPYMHPSAGGPPVVVERYCENSPEYGWQASAISTALFCDDDGAQLQRSLAKRIPVEILPVDRPRLLGLSSRARAAIDAGVRSSDIVHLHTLWHPLGSVVRKACAKHGRPYVTMPHGMLDPYSLGVKKWRKRFYMSLAEKANLKAASRIIYTTPEEARLAVDQMPWLPPGFVSPLGADEPPETPRQSLKDAFLTRFPEASGRRCLLFLGRLHPKKGLDRVLDALPAIVERFPDVLLVVAGDGEPRYLAGLRQHAESLGVAAQVTFTGILHGELKWGAFACAEAFLLLSRQENFAIAIAEAMRMAIPIIVTDRVNTWPIISEAAAGRVIHGTYRADTFLQYLYELLENPSLAQQMGQSGSDFAAERLTWPAATERVVACYEELLGPAPKG
jgi:glycosyltransferase involved in cell wall biosynthesis